MEFIDRLNALIAKTGMNVTTFEKACGMANGQVKQMRKAGRITNNMASKIHERFPIFDVLWLIYGTGETPTFIEGAKVSFDKVERNALLQMIADRDKKIIELEIALQMKEQQLLSQKHNIDAK